MSTLESEVCRICKATVPVENICQIFDSACIKLLEEIQEISGVNFRGIFEQPWYICMKCYADLITSQGFRKKCIESLTHRNGQQETTPRTMNENDSYFQSQSIDSPLTNQNDNYDIESEVKSFRVENPNKTDSENNNNNGSERPMNVEKICEICGNIFQTRKNFALHLRRHTNNKPYECELCMYKFFTNAELKCHMRRHTGEKPYECKYCDRKFSDYGTHKKHERTHTNDRPYPCNVCGRSFTTTFILKNHILTHTGKRDYECKICNKAFVHHTHLASHLKCITHRNNCKKAELKREEDKLRRNEMKEFLILR